jgi:hypothetical protein
MIVPPYRLLLAGSLFALAPAAQAQPGSSSSWCPQSEGSVFNYETHAGKVASICRYGGVHIYFFGTPGTKPDLVFAGPIVEERSGVALLSNGTRFFPIDMQDSSGFGRQSFTTGLLVEDLLVFKNDGWEFHATTSWPRPGAEADWEGDASKPSRSLVVIGPDGTKTGIR